MSGVNEIYESFISSNKLAITMYGIRAGHCAVFKYNVFKYCI